MKLKNQSGQALLIVLLSLSVVLIIVLYIVSRSITDITLSSKDEEALRAFSAAEAGIEQSLVTGLAASNTIGGASFSANVNSFAQGQDEVVYPNSLYSGESAVFWLVGHNSDGSLGCSSEACFTGSQARFCWGNPSLVVDESAPAAEITVVYKTLLGEYRVARVTADPYLTVGVRSTPNNFSAATVSNCTIGSEVFKYQTTINFASLGISNSTTEGVLQYARFRSLYNTTTPTKVALDVNYAGNSILPSQGVKVESSGSFGNSNRRIEVYQVHSVAPSVFDSVIYSSSGIVK